MTPLTPEHRAERPAYSMQETWLGIAAVTFLGLAIAALSWGIQKDMALKDAETQIADLQALAYPDRVAGTQADGDTVWAYGRRNIGSGVTFELLGVKAKTNDPHAPESTAVMWGRSQLRAYRREHPRDAGLTSAAHADTLPDPE